jgi:hypothetical protein
MNTKPKSLTLEQIDARLDVMEQRINIMYVSLEGLQKLIDALKSEK